MIGTGDQEKMVARKTKNSQSSGQNNGQSAGQSAGQSDGQSAGQNDGQSDDRRLWDEVARSVEPLDPLERAPRGGQPDLASAGTGRAGSPAGRSPPASSIRKKVIQDNFTRDSPGGGVQKMAVDDIPLKDQKKIQRGQRSIDLTIDLHGLTQKEAYARLTGDLAQAAEVGCRRVLVITGKGGVGGSSGRGILNQKVPEWLRSGGLSSLVSTISPAGPRHGGGGALYVTLRRTRSLG